VEARFRGRARYYPGIISNHRNRSDDSYDIAYDDGETETHVARYLIRIPDAGKIGVGLVGVRNGEITSPSTNPFARPAPDTHSPASASNPFARAGGVSSRRIADTGKNGGAISGRNNGEIIRTREGVSPSSTSSGHSPNPFARPATGGSSPAAACQNPFARQSGVSNPFSSPGGDRDRPRGSSSAAAPPGGGTGGGTGGTFVPHDNIVSRRNVRSADSVTNKSGLPEMVPKSQLAALKSSMSSGTNAPKRRGSKGTEDVSASSSGKGASVPTLDMKHSRSEQVFPRGGSAGAEGGDGGYSRISPRSSEGTPRRLTPRLDPLIPVRRRSGHATSDHASHAEREPLAQHVEQVRHRSMPPPVQPAVAVSQVVSKEFLIGDATNSTDWQCQKCHAVNPFIPDVDYCDHCSTRKGSSGRRGISNQVIKHD
jgi:hypothetical protein